MVIDIPRREKLPTVPHWYKVKQGRWIFWCMHPHPGERIPDFEKYIAPIVRPGLWPRILFDEPSSVTSPADPAGDGSSFSEQMESNWVIPWKYIYKNRGEK